MGCGKQVTPDNSNTALVTGSMLIRLTTAGPMDFTNYQYAFVFNSSGTGGEPYANAYTTSFLNYSFVWIVGAQNAGGSVGAALYEYFPVTNGISRIIVPVPSNDLQLVANSNGQGTQLTLQFQRSLFDTPIPSATATPTSVNPAPTSAAQNIWYMNPFTIAVSTEPNVVEDAGGLGPNDTSFSLPLDVSTYFDNTNPFQKAAANTNVSPAAQILGGEVENEP